MKFSTFLKLTGCLTALGLVYIHMQMKIIDLAYQAKAKENKIRKLIEQNGNITYTILTLKSSNHLGVKMLAQDSDMQFMDPNNIVRISVSEKVVQQRASNVEISLEKKFQPLMNLFSMGSQAEARDR